MRKETDQNLAKTINPILKMVKILWEKEKARSYLVGGAVRDFALGKSSKDLDIELHGITLEKLKTELKFLGNVSLVGKQFGVLKVYGSPFDWSLPRRDSAGRKPEVIIDPEMSIEEASRRRDLTMNAMAIDLVEIATSSTPVWNPTKIKIIDPFNGLNDIKNKILRAVDKKLFEEDPLRFYRVMQFLARFEMTPDEELDTLCKKIKLGTKLVAKERITDELKKLFLQSHRPSLGFRWVKKIGRLKELFPVLHQAFETPQRPDYHPEGDVFEHTMQTLDAAAALPIKLDNTKTIFFKDDEERLKIILGALCHDLGKISTTDKELHAYDHAKAGDAPTKAFLAQFAFGTEIIKTVRTLVRYHNQPVRIPKTRNPVYKIKKLAKQISPYANLRQLAMVCIADIRARNATSEEPLETQSENMRRFIELAIKHNVYEDPEPPVLTGKDLAHYMEPGPEMGKLLEDAYQIQISEDLHDVEKLRSRVLPNR